MNTFDAVVLGLIQGASEFLPISSSGHIYLGEFFLGIENDLSLALYLHIGTLLAVITYYHRDIWDLIRGFWRMISSGKSDTDGKTALLLGIATLATFPTGILVYLFIENNLSLQLVGVTLIITAGLIVISDYISRQYSKINKTNKTQTFSYPQAMTLGLVQGLSVLPGISRSGLTIATLLSLGIEREQSARLSFLLSVPTIAAATAYVATSHATQVDPLAAVVGIGVSFLVGYLSIAWMTRLVRRGWIWFAPYCLILGLVVLLYTA